MNRQVVEWVCYGVAQGTRARIANALSQGIALPDEDTAYLAWSRLEPDGRVKLVNAPTQDVGEHLSGMWFAANGLMEYTEHNSVLELIERTVARYKKGENIGDLINDAKVYFIIDLRYMSSHGLAEEIDFAINNLAKVGIFVNLDARPGEGGKA